MATAGFILPKISFLSITLDGGTDVPKNIDNPYIQDSSDILAGTSLTSTDFATEQPPEVMQVEIVMMIEVGFDVTSKNIYSYFLKEDFAKYLKILVSQSTNQETTNFLANNMSEFYQGTNIYDPSVVGLTNKIKKFSEFDGITPEASKEFGSSIEIKYDTSGNKIYCFPYKLTFEIPASDGGVKVNHLAYFTHAYIDIQEILTDEELVDFVALPQEMISALTTGQISQQVVIRDGLLNNFGRVFYVTPLDQNGSPTTFPPLKDNSNNVIGVDYSAAEIWTGPVHYHGGNNPGPDGYTGYMAGTPGADMGPFLTPVDVFNGIIQDFRQIKEISKIDFDYSLFSNSWFNQETTERLLNNMVGLKQLSNKDNPYLKDTEDVEKAVIKALTNSSNESIFTHFDTAMDGSGNTRFIFGINFREAIKQNSAFPKLVEHLFDNGMSLELLNQKLITELKIYRDRVYKENPADVTIDLYEKIKNHDSKLVVTTSESDNGVLISVQEYVSKLKKIVGTIKQVGIFLKEAPTDGIKFYTGTDLQTPNDGDYIFSTEITMKDPIIPWMKDRIDKLEDILYGKGFGVPTGLHFYGFKEYAMDAASNPDYYNSYTNRFTQSGISFLENKYPSSFVGLKLMEFFEELQKFTSFDDHLYALHGFLLGISSVNYGSPSGALRVFSILETTYKNILNLFASASKYKKPVDAPHVGVGDYGDGESIYLAAGSNPNRSFTIKKKFASEIKGEINHLTGYDYLSFNNTVLEDTPVTDGLKNMSYAAWEDRVNKELTKIFPVVPHPTDSAAATSESTIDIFKAPLADYEVESGDAALFLIQKQGDIPLSQKKKEEAEENVKYLQAIYDALVIVDASNTPTGIEIPPGYYEMIQESYDAGFFLPVDVIDYARGKLNKAKQDLGKVYQEHGELLLEIEQLQNDIPAQIEQLQGASLNPGDSIQFTKNTFLSPSIVNFAKAESENLLNNGTIRTDIGNLNNIMLNIMKRNFNLTQGFDFPEGDVATGAMFPTQDKIISNKVSNELKYDLLTLLTQKQCSIFSLEDAQLGAASIPNTPAGVLIGGATGETAVTQEDLYTSGLASATTTEKADIFVSDIDPTVTLLTSTEQGFFNFLSDPRWTWEYYVENFDETFYQEYAFWLMASNFLNPDPYIDNNTPLKRAPNHVKALMLYLDWTKSFTNPAFTELKDYLQANKPYVYKYDIPAGQAYLNQDSSNFFGLTPMSYEINGITGYPLIPKNKVLYQTPEFMSFFMLNYKNIVRVEALTGFAKNDNNESSVSQPIWHELTHDMATMYKEAGLNVLCRLVAYEKELYGVKRYGIMDLPIYNEHFIIKFGDLTPLDTGPASVPTEGGSPITEIPDEEFIPEEEPRSTIPDDDPRDPTTLIPVGNLVDNKNNFDDIIKNLRTLTNNTRGVRSEDINQEPDNNNFNEDDSPQTAETQTTGDEPSTYSAPASNTVGGMSIPLPSGY